MRIVVAGAGMAGLSAALALARGGHEITLLERDSTIQQTAWKAVLQSRREGIPHFFQPHAFWPRGCLLLKRNFPDVYQLLLDIGACELRLYQKIRGDAQPGDEDLVYLGVRRPLIEWALLQAVRKELNISVRGAVRAVGLLGKPGITPRITGVCTDAGDVEGDLVVDALGRSSPATSWLEALGAARLRTESNTCGLIYYSRHFELGAEAVFPLDAWLISPRGDLGYAGFFTFIEDNRTFGIVLAIPTSDGELRVLQHESAFMTACQQIPILAELISSTFARPSGTVLPGGGLLNTLRHYAHNDRPAALGLFPLGDSLCHTNPAYALGLTFTLIQAFELRDTLQMISANDPESHLLDYLGRIMPEVNERFTLCSTLDSVRARLWQGEHLDFSHRTGCFPQFMFVAPAAVALQDGEICRKTLRRMGVMDRLSVFDEDITLQQRVEDLFNRKLSGGHLRAPSPERSDLVRIVTEQAAAPPASRK